MKRCVKEQSLLLESVGRVNSMQPNQLKMDYQLANKTVTIQLDGQITSEMMDDFADELLALFSAGMNVHLDLSKVTYIAPSVVEKLLRLQSDYVEKLGLCMVLLRMQASLQEWFRKNHYSQLFDMKGAI